MTVSRRRLFGAAALLILIVGLFFVVRNQVKVYRSRQRAAAEAQDRQQRAAGELQHRQSLFDLLQPVALSNCKLERFGETNDGGYLMCGNLLDSVQAGYSYGISGYDKWGCDISTKRKVRLHQYRLLQYDGASVSDRGHGISPGVRGPDHRDCRWPALRHDRQSDGKERRSR